MSFIFLFLREYIRHISIEKYNFSIYNVLKFILLSVIIITTHIWTWAILLISLSILIIWNTLDVFLSKNSNLTMFKRMLRLYLFIVIPNIIIVILSDLLLGISLLDIFNFGFWGLDDFWLLSRESVIGYLLAIIGVIIIISNPCFRRSLFVRLILSWCLTLSFILLFVRFDYPYRLYILYPVSILIGYGFYGITIIVKVYLLRVYSFKDALPFHKMIPFLLWLALFSSILYQAYIPEYVYYPDEITMSQIKWLYSRYGFENGSVIILTFNPRAKPLKNRSSPHVDGWVRGYLGGSAYFGHLFSLLYGLPDKFSHITNYINKTIVLADRLYTMTPIEYELSEKISDLGIYVIRNVSLVRAIELLETYGYKLSVNYMDIIAPLSMGEYCSLMLRNRSILLEYSYVMSGSQRSIYMKFTKNIINFTATYLFFHVSLTLANVTLRIRAYDNDWHVIGSVKQPLFSNINLYNNSVWLVLPMKEGYSDISYLEFSVIGKSNTEVSFKMVIDTIIAI
ncbi:MAG: hypothetical protein ABGF52_01640 [Candidatus Asgardarchaeum sp.]